MTHNPLASGLQTEADVDVRVLVPHLEALGFGPGNLRAQRTFSIRLGRNVLRAGGRDERTGRVDYLVTNDEDEPYFVLEVKGPAEPLTDDDRDQGISYARLVHPMAPLVLLTNGHESQLFDTVTKHRLNAARDAAMAEDGTASDDLSLRLRAEALEHFLGYSRENVASFSKAQVRTGMEGLRGEGEHFRKYEPDLYVARPGARDAFTEFLQQNRKVVFALGGPSGVGKTNEMCALAESCVDRHVTLFLHGPDLGASIAATLTDVFAWHFAEALSLPHICRRLSALARRSGAPVLLFIDAIDEVVSPHIVQELGALASHLGVFAGGIRLIVSAKTAEWSRLLRVRDVDTPLSREVFVPARTNGRPHGDADTSEAGGAARKNKDDPGASLSWRLDRFDAEESAVAQARYAGAFGVDPRVLQRHGGDPFLLRIAAEVAHDQLQRAGAASPDMPLDERTLVRAYLDAKLARMVDGEVARRELVHLAQVMVQHPASRAMADGPTDAERAGTGSNAEINEPSVERAGHEAGEDSDLGTVAPLAEARARSAAHLSVGDPFADELVAFGVLLRMRDADGAASLAFAYDRVRDYVVSTFGYAFPILATSEVASTLRSCMTTPIGRAAFLWFLPYFTEDQWVELQAFVGQRAEEALAIYEGLRSHVFPPARDAMDQARSFPLGVVCCLARTGQTSLGYFPRWREDLPRVLVERDPAGPWNESIERRSRGIRPSVEIFRTAPWFVAHPGRAAADHMADQLQRLHRKGHLLTLDEDLLLERAVAFTIAHARELDFNRSNDDTFVRLADHTLGTELFPLNISDLRARVQLALALRWHGETYGSRERAEAEARRELEAGRDFSDTLVGDGELRALALTLAELPHGIHEISAPLLPGPDLPCEMPGDGWRSFERFYSDAQLVAFIEVLFGRALSATRRIVESAFDPTLRVLMGPIPTGLDVECYRYADEDSRLLSVYQLSIRLAILTAPDGGTNDDGAVTVRLVDSAGWQRRGRWDTTVDYGRRGSVTRWHEFGSSMLFAPHGTPPMIPGGTTWGGAIGFAPVRSMVHLLLTGIIEACDVARVRRFAERPTPTVRTP